MYKCIDVSPRKKSHNEIFNLYNQGLGYKRIHRKLVENGWKVGKSPNTIDSIIKKRMKRNGKGKTSVEIWNKEKKEWVKKSQSLL
jgi:hypothetical protein